MLLKAFLKKTKKGLELVSLSQLLHDFWTKIFLTLYFINWPNFIPWLSSFLKILGNMYIVIIWYPVCDVINLKINLSFLIKPFFCITRPAQTSPPQSALQFSNPKGFLRRSITNAFPCVVWFASNLVLRQLKDYF